MSIGLKPNKQQYPITADDSLMHTNATIMDPATKRLKVGAISKFKLLSYKLYNLDYCTKEDTYLD